MIDSTGRLLDANVSWATATGTTQPGRAGNRIHELVFEADRDQFAATVATVLRDGATSSVVTRFSASGPRWWWCRLTAINSDRCYINARDVTRNREEEETAAWLAAMVASSEDAIITKSLDGIVLSWNAGAERIYGYTAEEMVGQPITRLAPAGRKDEVSELLALVSRGEAVTHRETVRIRKDGTRVEVSLMVSPMRSPDGVITGASVISRDVTARRRAETEQTRQLIASASDPFVLLDDQGVIIEWNRRAVEVLGWSRDEAVGRRFADIVLAPEDREDHHRRLKGILQAQDHELDGFATERTYVGRDGRRVPMEARLWRATTIDGIVVGGFLRDVTARRQIEQSLAEARDRAVEAAELKSHFMASMSHEIRTPMNAVMGLTGLLLGSTTLTTIQRRYADGIRTAGESLMSVINDILDFSKIEAGRLTLDEVDFAPNRVVEDVVELVAEQARVKGLELAGSYSAELPPFRRGDPTRLRQILLNLATNAVKFTHRGEITVRAVPDADTADHHRAGGTRHIRFEVSDTGIGIGARAQQRLFEPFTQADSSTTREFGGTGLGLAICRELVHLMGGTIGVNSEPGAGSTFWCSIPFAPPSEHDRSSELNALDGLRVLVVDDNETNRTILQEQLHSWRAVPTPAGGAAAALLELHRAAGAGQPYQLTLLDYHMPDMNGAQLAEVITTSANIPAHPIVMLSSNMEVDHADVADNGVQAVLIKPVRQSVLYDQLIQVVNSGIDRSGAAGGEPADAPERVPGLAGTVLLVEDNELNRMVGVGILQHLGYHVDTAADGGEAVTMVTEHRYDAVMMDCHMPGMDGYTATREIRALEGTKRHTPIIALTAAALPEDRSRCAAAGMDDFITKPVDPSSIEEHLHRWIHPEAPAGQPQSPPPDPADQVRAAISDRLDRFCNLNQAAGNELRQRVLQTFLTTLPKLLANLADALAAADAAQVEAIAHSIRGLTDTVGASTVAALCADLEASARDRLPHGGPESLAAIRTAAEDAIVAVRELLELQRTGIG